MEKNWWKGKVAYQIYPKSFKDSIDDGIGDLKGITEILDYLKDLGVDIVWLSPMFKSPFVDQGYDISDYYAVDPIFGTDQDMDELIAEAKKRDMYIVLDLVVNH
ncbi:alpha-amylase family glycosyl hydrolase, partial [Streptococcus pyogenes]